MSFRSISLRISQQVCGFVLIATLFSGLAEAQVPTRSAGGKASSAKTASAFPWSLMPGVRSVTPAGGPSLPVSGSGTLGRLTKWTGFTGSNSVIGDSTIFEDKFGKVGVGTDAPTSRFTVAGMIETTLGGVKFPDGTVQTTAVVGALQSVFHDSTLRGDGTSISPLGIALPLRLSGATQGNTAVPLVIVVNDAAIGVGVRGVGLIGVEGVGADRDSDPGAGLVGRGGNSSTASEGGTGISTGGGRSANGEGGTGIFARGGQGGTSGGIGIIAQGGAGPTEGLAGVFAGDVQVTGNLSKGGGSFKIDHPLDPENKYLYHSFVESPDMKNIYDGTVITDASGDATVELPDYFDALNRDFRYQLTVIGTFAQAIVYEEIENNHFHIRTSAPNVKVSWQVTGIRQDSYANKHRIPVEESKPGAERGTYLHPDSFNQPEEKNVLFVQHREITERVQELQKRK